MWPALAFLLAFGLRAYINRGATTATPDEKLYSMYAAQWRPGKAYRTEIGVFLAQSWLEIPPTRFAFFAICALVTPGKKTWVQCFNPVTWVAVVSGAAAAPLAWLITRDEPSTLLVATSPLSLMLSRRALQDSFAALPVLLALVATAEPNAWLLGASVALALMTREALLLYLPAFLAAWGFKTGAWGTGALTLLGGGLSAVLLFYVVGGRQLLPVFRKLRMTTDYVVRFQSGLPHRILVDLVLVSPVTTIAGIVACVWAPPWVVAFVIAVVAVHAGINPKNLRFLLPIEVALRMLCAWLPSPWNWGILALGLISDFRLYRAVGGCKDPVTYNLVVRTGMYQEKAK